MNKIQKIREEVEKQLNLLERFAEKLKNGLRIKHRKENGMTDKEKIITDLKQALDGLDITSNLRLVLINTIENLQKESISEDFEEALANEWKGYIDRGAATVDALEDNTQELTFAKGFYRGAKWKEQMMTKATVDSVKSADKRN